MMWKAQSRQGADRELMWRLDSHPAACAINVSAHRAVRHSGLKLLASSADLLLLHTVDFCNTLNEMHLLLKAAVLLVLHAFPNTFTHTKKVKWRVRF